MDYGLLLAASLIGLSFQNSFACVFLTFSASAGQGLKAGIGFVAGRFLGIMLLGSIFALLGSLVEIDVRAMLYLFGGLTIVMGILLLWNPPFLWKIGLARKCEQGACGECGDAVKGGRHDCATCSSKDGCVEKRPPSRWGNLGFFAAGFVRGGTPCVKLVLLVPLLVTLPFFQGAAITTAYALTSSIYPIVGIAFASIMSDLSPRKWGPYLSKAAAITMIGIGIYFLYKAWIFTCPSV